MSSSCASLSCSVWFYLYLKMVERCFRNFQFWLKPQTLVGFNLDHATYLHNWKNKWHNKTRRISLLPILLSSAINARNILKFKSHTNWNKPSRKSFKPIVLIFLEVEQEKTSPWIFICLSLIALQWKHNIMVFFNHLT